MVSSSMMIAQGATLNFIIRSIGTGSLNMKKSLFPLVRLSILKKWLNLIWKICRVMRRVLRTHMLTTSLGGRYIGIHIIFGRDH